MSRRAGGRYAYPTLTERKAWSYAVADKRIPNRSIDAPLPIEAVQCPTCGAHPERPCMVESGEQRQPHQERTRIADTLNKMRELLLSSESSTCASDAFLEVSRRVYFGWLLQLLYDAACCRHAQREKADDFINSLAGLNTDELGYWPKRIRNFASELKNRLKKNIFTLHDAACDNTEEDEAGFLWLHRIADRIESDIGLLKTEVGYRHEAYPKAIYTLREYMGSFRGMEALLNETNKVLEFSGYTFREKNLRDTYRHYLEVRASGE